MVKYLVSKLIQHDDGSLTLYVFDGDKAVYSSRTPMPARSPHIFMLMNRIKNGEDPTDWEDGSEDPTADWDKTTSQYQGWRVVARGGTDMEINLDWREDGQPWKTRC